MSSLLTPNGVELISQFSPGRQIGSLRRSQLYKSNVGPSKISCDARMASFGARRSSTGRTRPSTREATQQFLSLALSRKQEEEVSTLDQSPTPEALTLVEEIRQACATPVERLHAVMDAMVAEFEAGLAADGEDLKMLPAFLETLPTGKEKGCFYALDLGGTNFRVMRARFGGESGLLGQEAETYTIPEKLMLGENDDLFDFIAGKLGDFVVKEHELHRDANRKRELGFTFSFPVEQHSIASGTLIHWSKGFKVNGTVGKDIVKVLREAIQRKGLDLAVAALVNDTVGCLAEGRYRNKDVMMAVILGTGTNACYVEKAEAVPKWKEAPPKSGEHVINTEWGNFNSPTLPTTFADDDLDQESVNPGHHTFEKMMSGMYLGEIVRRFVLRLAQEGALFTNYSTGPLSHNWSLSTPNISKAHSDKSPSLEAVGETLSQVLGIQSSTIEERKTFISIVDIVARRGARLAAAGIAAVLKKMGRLGGVTSNGNGNGNGNGSSNFAAPQTVVAMDGGLYSHYPEFRAYMVEALEEIVGKAAASRVSFKQSKDGSGIGAVLLAACHSQYRNAQ